MISFSVVYLFYAVVTDLCTVVTDFYTVVITNFCSFVTNFYAVVTDFALLLHILYFCLGLAALKLTNHSRKTFPRILLVIKSKVL